MNKEIYRVLKTPELEEEKKLEHQVLQMAGGIPRPILTPEEIFRIQEAKRKIDEILLTLSPREEKIVRRHIMGDETFEQVSQDFCLSRSRAQQINARAIRKLRHSLLSEQLREFVGV